MEKHLKIEGMHCMHCAKKVQTALEALGAEVEVALEEKVARVKHTCEIDDEALIAAVEGKGFKVTGISKK